MRKLSLHRVYGCSTAHRHSLIGLPANRVAFLAGSYLVILDCTTGEQRYLSFTSIDFLYVSSSGARMAIIDRSAHDADTRIHIYSTQRVDLLITIEPNRFGSFIGVSIDATDRFLMILHGEPAYMITIQEMQVEEEERSKTLDVTDVASVRAVHGPVVNRMTKREILPHVAFVSFAPHSSDVFCATGEALFKLYEIDNQAVHQQSIHFRAEFYHFTCHCWLAVNSILVATEHGHVFWIVDGSIRSDVSLEESIGVPLQPAMANLGETLVETSAPSEGFSASHTELLKEKPLDFFTKETHASGKNQVYLDLLTADEISPNFIVTFREYLFVFAPTTDEPFFQISVRRRLQSTPDDRNTAETHRIHKLSYMHDSRTSLLYLQTDRNQIFQYKLKQSQGKIDFETKHIYGFHAYDIVSAGLCAHKPWLITLGGDNWLRIFDFKDNDREIASKYVADGARAVTSSDPYGFQVCLAEENRVQLCLITNHELRLIDQYEVRGVRALELSHSGHLVAVITSNLIKIYSTVHMNLVSHLRGHVGRIKQVLWARNDSIVISCGPDGMIYIFNIFTGMREGEIITKQFRYVGIAAASDCSRIYAITSDSSIKVFNRTTLELEWSIESGFIPTAICLSKSERMLYVGMTNGIIRVYTIPLAAEAYVDLPGHYSSIRRLLVSNDDEYLVSIGESAYLLLFKQTLRTLSSVTSHLSFAQFNLGSLDAMHKPKPASPPFEYVLVTKSEFQEQQRKIEDVEARISEFETENNLKLHSQQILFTNNLNLYSTKFQDNMQQLLLAYEQLRTEITTQQDQFAKRTDDLQEHHEATQYRMEVAYEDQMMQTLVRIEDSRKLLEHIRAEYQSKQLDHHAQDWPDLEATVRQVNVVLQSKWRSAAQDYERMQDKERQIHEYLNQMEVDIDDEIEQVKINYENELNFLRDYIKRLTVTMSTLRKRYNAIVDRMESRDTERNTIEQEVTELRSRQFEFIDKLDHIRAIIKKREDRIGTHDIKIHRLQQHILHVEKRKYVLDYKTKSLLERIEPLDQEISRLKNNNQNLEQQLTVLKRQQNDLLVREHEFEVKLEQSSKKLKTAKVNHQHIWKTVQERKEAIKKAFEYTEISCTSLSNHAAREQLTAFIRDMCRSMQNEQQTEKQLELQGFMKEWSNQRQWLVEQLHGLSKQTEDNKQTFAHSQREHRKTIAPFINQLRHLHQLKDETQKKIQKRFALLKIKSNEQNGFLETISTILHVDERLHSTMAELSQQERHIEVQDEEIDRLASIVFRQQYASPCSESNQVKSITNSEKTRTRATLPSLSPL